MENTSHLELVSSDYLVSASNKSILKKRVQNLGFQHWQKRQFIEKHKKTTRLCQSAVAKPLELEKILGYPWEDNIYIFHLAPTFLKSDD